MHPGAIISPYSADVWWFTLLRPSVPICPFSVKTFYKAFYNGFDGAVYLGRGQNERNQVDHDEIDFETASSVFDDENLVSQ